jgi:hypothetical protein
MGRKLHCKAAHETFQARLGGVHMNALPGANMVRDAAQRDKGAAASRNHARHDGLGQQEGAVERDGHDLAPFSEIHLKEGRLAAQPGIADRDIHAAESLRRQRGHCRNRLRVRHVGQHGQSLAARRPDFRRYGLNRLPIAAAVHDHGRTIGRQRKRDRAADILAGPGDQRDLAGERLGLRIGHRALL